MVVVAVAMASSPCRLRCFDRTPFIILLPFPSLPPPPATSPCLFAQFIAGAIEQRVFDTLLAKQPGLSSLGSTAVRSANLYLGSLTIVDWLRYVGLQH